MKVKNMTGKMQPLNLTDLAGRQEFVVYVEAYGICDIAGMYISNMNKLRGIFELIKDNEVKETETTPAAPAEDELPKEEIKEGAPAELESQETTIESASTAPEVTSLESKFICDICGQEFASAKGLNSHKTRVHS